MWFNFSEVVKYEYPTQIGIEGREVTESLER